MGLLHGNFFYDSYFRRIILFFLVSNRSKKSADVVFLSKMLQSYEDFFRIFCCLFSRG